LSFGAGFPLFASAMNNNLSVGWASSALGFLPIVFIPIPTALYIFGKKIRKQSKRARHDISRRQAGVYQVISAPMASSDVFGDGIE
jgi:DHA1 family multidrug resistance protein-like MFS transporter